MTDRDEAEEEAQGGSAPALHSSALLCDTCGKVTPHRILHLQRGVALPGEARPRSVQGIARCRVCGTVHPFQTRPPERSVAVTEVLSDGPRSTRRRIEIPIGRKVQVGTGVPGSDVRVTVRAIDRRDGRRVSEARAEDVGTVWVERDTAPRVRVSIIEGRRTSTTTLAVEPETAFEVGQTLALGGVELTVTMLRARGESWRRPGDRFRSAEIQRLYARRAFTPPAGRRDWSTERETPVSRASSTSRSARSRSSPGVKRKRTVPRARTAD